ncbi:hypothetical protein DMUE_4765 [Dictyocoela muelleri]|nr:hypothetical protein DMUE_4765 [Dictyocoela muelleri]
MGYSPVNTKCYINVSNSKGINISVLCAITQNGIFDFQIKIGGFKSSDILNFDETKLSLLTHENRKKVILDNASIHKTANVIESFARRNYILKFLPPYSPQLNPIEEFFTCLKSRVKQRGGSSNRDILISTIDDILRNDEFIMEGYFIHMRSWLEKAIVFHDII